MPAPAGIRNSWAIARVRRAAAKRLGRARPSATSALPDLLVAMNDASPGVASTATWSVGLINSVSPSSESIAALAKQINHPNGEVRRYSAFSLGMCGRSLYGVDQSLFRSVLIPALVEKLDDPYMSNGATQALEMIGDETLPALKRLASTSDPRLKKLAANAVISVEKRERRW